MYRYCVDNVVTYSSEDIVLFRESPFAAWMERLTLDNPRHGIAPDADTPAPNMLSYCRSELAEMLRAENKHVEDIDLEAAEPQRRTATLGAMRSGVDFIINGQLAVGPLSGPANLLMRTSGYSELGNYLYVPCNTEAKTTLDSAFRLCFLADLLHSLQGQLPPQMLVIRSSSDLLPLKTEDHIYHYLAVKRRFMRAMAEFRSHRIPDPSASVHFGRWSAFAYEELRKRTLQDGELEEESGTGDEVSGDVALPDLAGLGSLNAGGLGGRLAEARRTRLAASGTLDSRLQTDSWPRDSETRDEDAPTADPAPFSVATEAPPATLGVSGAGGDEKIFAVSDWEDMPVSRPFSSSLITSPVDAEDER